MNGGTTLRRFAIPAFRIRASVIRGALIRAALPALAGALVLAGCGGSGSGRQRPLPGPPPAATASAGLSAFQTCLKQHGVTVTPGQFSDPAARVLLPRRLPVRIAAPGRVRRPGFGRVQGLR